jgi:cytochrome d ubiquinol oxidase subunit II
VLAVAFSGYLAAVYLAADARRLAEPALVHDFRIRALVAGFVAGALALAGLLVIHADDTSLWHGLTTGAGLAMVILCALAGIVTLVLVWRGRFGPARATAALAVAAVIAGWAAAQEPRLLPGLTVGQAAAGRSTLIATIVGVAVGAVVLVPSLIVLYTLVLRGRLDTDPKTSNSLKTPKGPKRPAAAGRGVASAGVAAGRGVAPTDMAAAGPRVPSGGAAAAAAGPGVRPTGVAAAAFPRVRLAGLLAVATLAAGVGLLVFADPAWAHGIGAISLLACAVTVFALATGPDEKPDALHGRQKA